MELLRAAGEYVHVECLNSVLQRTTSNKWISAGGMVKLFVMNN